MDGENPRRYRGDGAVVVSPLVCRATAPGAPLPGDRPARRADASHLDGCARHTGDGEVGTGRGRQSVATGTRCGHSRFHSDANRRLTTTCCQPTASHCYRGRTVTWDFQLGPTFRGAMARLLDEVRRATPPPVWPVETLPGLWNIPSSAFLYPIGGSRTRVVGLQSRIERFSRGLEAAARLRGIFHFCLHPENLTESPQGFALFEDILELTDSSPRSRRYRDSDDERDRRPYGARARKRSEGPSACAYTRKDTSMTHRQQHSHS